MIFEEIKIEQFSVYSDSMIHFQWQEEHPNKISKKLDHQLLSDG